MIGCLKDRGIGYEIYYPVPMHEQECFASLAYKPSDFPESHAVAREVLAIPVYPELTHAMQDEVVDAVLRGCSRESWFRKFGQADKWRICSPAA